MKYYKILCMIWLFCFLGTFQVVAQGVIAGPKKPTRTNSQPKKSDSSNPKKSVRKTQQQDHAVVVYEETVTIVDSVATHGYINGHEWVDLGLPSGTKWATCNVGASKPEEYGHYYAWGEIKPKNEYTELNSLTYNKTTSWLKSLKIIDEKGILTPEYDVASVNWGDNWHIPTFFQCEELLTYCKWSKTRFRYVEGFRIAGPNGNYIFIPATGGMEGSTRHYVNICAASWSSTVYTDDGQTACSLNYFESDAYTEPDPRYCGLTVRAVTK